jgi:hypothetical protein
MGKKKYRNHLFVDCVGDHAPRHVHIFKDKKLVGKWDIENQQMMGTFKMTSAVKMGLEFLGYKKRG